MQELPHPPIGELLDIGEIFNEFEIIWYVDDHIFKRLDVRNHDRYRVYHERSCHRGTSTADSNSS